MPKVASFQTNVDQYESWFELNRFAYESELEAVRALLPRFKKGLEIGVGTGRFAALLGLRYGVDPSSKMSEVARKRGIKVILGVAESLPCKTCSFDLVFMSTTICFLDDVFGALNEAHRMLTGGGDILIGFIDRESELGKIYQAKKTGSVFYRDAIFLSVDEVLYYLDQAGFGNFLFRQTVFSHPANMKHADPVKHGYGEGSFVVVRGKKPVQ